MENLAYTDEGSGLPVVLLHGFCETKSIWQPLLPGLSASFRVLCLDLPGFGQSPLPAEGGLSIETMADAVKSLLDSLSIEKPVLIGHSMGGYVSLALAEAYPTYLAGLGLFHSTAFPDSPEKKQNRDQTVKFIRENGGQKFARSMFPALFSAASRQQKPERVEAFLAAAEQTPEESMVQATLAMRNRPDRRQVLGKMGVPVLFIAGKEDVAVPVLQTTEEAALPPDASLHVMEDIGHMGMLEASSQTGKALANFIDYCQGLQG